MMSSTSITASGPSNSIPKFHTVLQSSKRILALCGAGLSAASGLETFRGAGGMWRNNQATTLATPEAFAKDPGLVWLFYSYRRHKALMAKPISGHFALAELARTMGDDFWCISQNVDGKKLHFTFHFYLHFPRWLLELCDIVISLGNILSMIEGYIKRAKANIRIHVLINRYRSLTTQQSPSCSTQTCPWLTF